jgi:cytochrome c5
MTLNSLTSLLLLHWVSTAAAWSRTDHWHTTVRPRGARSTTSLDTSSITVIPTGDATPISSNVSTTLVTERARGGYGNYYTFEVTVTDLFYADNATGICTPILTDCSSSATRSVTSSSSTITTNYYAPVIISNPASCTRTSFAYTTAKSLSLRPTVTGIPDFDQQAIQDAHALVVTTYVSTLSTNLGGQDVTTSVCDVYHHLAVNTISSTHPHTSRTAAWCPRITLSLRLKMRQE